MGETEAVFCLLVTLLWAHAFWVMLSTIMRLAVNIFFMQLLFRIFMDAIRIPLVLVEYKGQSLVKKRK
jgi:hypothetical protein